MAQNEKKVPCIKKFQHLLRRLNFDIIWESKRGRGRGNLWVSWQLYLKHRDPICRTWTLYLQRQERHIKSMRSSALLTPWMKKLDSNKAVNFTQKIKSETDIISIWSAFVKWPLPSFDVSFITRLAKRNVAYSLKDALPNCSYKCLVRLF